MLTNTTMRALDEIPSVVVVLKYHGNKHDLHTNGALNNANIKEA